MDTIKILYQQLEKMQSAEERIDQLVLIANRFMYVDLERFGAALEEVRQLSEKSGNSIGMYHYHYGMGRLLTKKVNLQSAMEHFEQAYVIAQKLDNKRFLATCQYSFSIVNINLGNFAEGYKQAKESVKLFSQQKGEELNLSIAYGYVGVSSENLGKYDEAEAAYKKALSIVSSGTEPAAWTGLMVNYAVFKTKLKHYPEALEVYLDALDVMELTTNKLGVSQTLVNIGEVYFMMGDTHNALKYCVNGLKMLRYVENKKALIKVHVCLTEIYMAMGGLKEAEQKIRQAMELSETIDMPAAECHIAGARGELYYLQGDLLQAKEWLKKACDIANTKGFIELAEKFNPLYNKLQA